MRRFLPVLTALIACNGADGEPTDTDAATDIDTDCGYPEDAAEPMAEGEPLFPYSWPDARSMADGVTEVPLDLANVPCANDPEIDWREHEALMFVSVPAF